MLAVCESVLRHWLWSSIHDLVTFVYKIIIVELKYWNPIAQISQGSKYISMTFHVLFTTKILTWTEINNLACCSNKWYILNNSFLLCLVKIWNNYKHSFSYYSDKVRAHIQIPVVLKGNWNTAVTFHIPKCILYKYTLMVTEAYSLIRQTEKIIQCLNRRHRTLRIAIFIPSRVVWLPPI